MASTDGVGGRRKNLALLRHRLYMGERRRTEPVVESSGAGEHGALRRSQSDRTEYGQKLQGTPGKRAGCCDARAGWEHDASGLQCGSGDGHGRLCPGTCTTGPSDCPRSPPCFLNPAVHAAREM